MPASGRHGYVAAVDDEDGLGAGQPARPALAALACDAFTSPFAEEFARTLREIERGPLPEALQNLRKRTEVPELSNFVLTRTQADALGMPVGLVLKTPAGEMRSKRHQWAREKAAELPVKILFPPILFNAPATFVVLPGPGASVIGGAFG